jgi:hypothetical protein
MSPQNSLVRVIHDTPERLTGILPRHYQFLIFQEN